MQDLSTELSNALKDAPLTGLSMGLKNLAERGDEKEIISVLKDCIRDNEAMMIKVIGSSLVTKIKNL